MDELQVREVVAGVPAAVGFGRRLDRVEGLADGAVGKRVDVHLEALAVEEGDDVRQLVRLVHPDPAVVRRPAVPVEVRLEDGRCEVLEDAVLEDLRAANPETADRALLASPQKVVELLVAALARPAEVALGAHGQQAALGERAVRRQRLGLDCRVLPGRDPPCMEPGLGAEDRLLPLLGRRLGNEVLDEPHRAFLERPGGLSVGVALDPAVGGVGGLARNPGELERPRVRPGAVAVAVHEEGRPVGDKFVEVALERSPAREGVHRPAVPEDPVAVGMLGGIARDSLEAFLARLGLVQSALKLREAAVRRVEVRVLEAREHHAAAELDDACPGACELGEVGRGSHGFDPARRDGKCLRGRPRGVDRVDPSSGQEQVSGHRRTLGKRAGEFYA